MGFGSKSPHPMEVARKRASERDRSPVCSCGSEDVIAGEFVGVCDRSGQVRST
jgi:hypothetical protein